MWRWAIIATLLAACGQEQVNVPNADAGDVDLAATDAADVGVDTYVPDPPRALAPCEATDCRQSTLGGPPCSTYETEDAFDGEFGVHAYASMVWDGVQTRITVEPRDDFDPVIVLARLNGEVLFDGDIGAVRPPFNVTAESAASITVSTVQATGIVVYVTSAAALDAGFENLTPTGAYTLSIESDCGERVRCVVNERDTGDPECSWLHYVGRNVIHRLDGTPDQQLATAAAASWWALKEGRMSTLNPIVRSDCDGTELDPLQTCNGTTWSVGLAGANVIGQNVSELEDLATRLYDGAMTSGILRSTANEAALARDDVASVMESEGEIRASWLLRNSAVGLSTQADWVTQACIEADSEGCFGSGSENSRHYAPDRDTGLRSIEDLQRLLSALSD